MQKHCPFCNAPMPEEASFCLHCFSILEGSKAVPTPKVQAHKTARTIATRFKTAERCSAVALTLIFLTGMVTSLVGNPLTGAPTPLLSPNGYGVLPASAAKGNPNGENEPTDGTAGETALTAEDTAQSLIAAFPKPSDILTDGGSVPSTSPSADASDNSDNPAEPTKPAESSADKKDPMEQPEYNPKLYTYKPDEGDRIAITGYTGSAAKVIVPAVIDGKVVCRISEGTFQNCKALQEITLETDTRQTYLWVNDGCVTNCPNLTTFNFNQTDLGIYGGFAKACPKLREVNIDNDQYRFIDGALYYWSSQEWLLRFYAEGETQTELTVPTWCAGIENVCNLEDNPYLKVLRLHKYTKRFPQFFFGTNPNFEAVYVEEGHPQAFDCDGVLFTKSSSDALYYANFYPAGKTNKVFKMPENSCLKGYNKSAYQNSYLEELWLPKTASIQDLDTVFYERCFRNLQRVYLQEGHSLENYVRTRFTGELYIY